MAHSPERSAIPAADWPDLPLNEWQSTLDTLQMWLQIVGKIKLKLVPFQNQWWNITLLPTLRGLTTGIIPFEDRTFEIEFDFVGHQLFLRESTGGIRVVVLEPRSVADFYHELMSALASFGIETRISRTPVEVPHTTPYDENTEFSDYDPEYVNRFWRIMLGTVRALQRFQSGFTGKASPVHFFWGSFDLNHTRHSGRPATVPDGAPRFFQLAENEENFSCGFWPGNISASGLTYGEPAFFSYLYPEPAGFRETDVAPGPAYFDERMGLFILRYDDARASGEPERAILEFFNSVYSTGAVAAGWDRARLEAIP